MEIKPFGGLGLLASQLWLCCESESAAVTGRKPESPREGARCCGKPIARYHQWSPAEKKKTVLLVFDDDFPRAALL